MSRVAVAGTSRAKILDQAKAKATVCIGDSAVTKVATGLPAGFDVDIQTAAAAPRVTPHSPSAVAMQRRKADGSWNATKRALEWGYRGALWYRDGTDGWSEASLPLAEAQPPSDAPH